MSNTPADLTLLSPVVCVEITLHVEKYCMGKQLVYAVCYTSVTSQNKRKGGGVSLLKCGFKESLSRHFSLINQCLKAVKGSFTLNHRQAHHW